MFCTKNFLFAMNAKNMTNNWGKSIVSWVNKMYNTIHGGRVLLYSMQTREVSIRYQWRSRDINEEGAN